MDLDYLIRNWTFFSLDSTLDDMLIKSRNLMWTWICMRPKSIVQWMVAKKGLVLDTIPICESSQLYVHEV
jgi:hypothetical protein